jgi:hypothetical protein
VSELADAGAELDAPPVTSSSGRSTSHGAGTVRAHRLSVHGL